MDNTVATSNGWANRETRLVALWLNKDPESYEILQKARKVRGDWYAKEDWLESEIRDILYMRFPEDNLWSDLLDTALWRVDWGEVLEENTLTSP